MHHESEGRAFGAVVGWGDFRLGRLLTKSEALPLPDPSQQAVHAWAKAGVATTWESLGGSCQFRSR